MTNRPAFLRAWRGSEKDLPTHWPQFSLQTHSKLQPISLLAAAPPRAPRFSRAIFY